MTAAASSRSALWPLTATAAIRYPSFNREQILQGSPEMFTASLWRKARWTWSSRSQNPLIRLRHLLPAPMSSVVRFGFSPLMEDRRSRLSGQAGLPVLQPSPDERRGDDRREYDRPPSVRSSHVPAMPASCRRRRSSVQKSDTGTARRSQPARPPIRFLAAPSPVMDAGLGSIRATFRDDAHPSVYHAPTR